MQLCVGISTKNASHNNDLCAMYDKIVNCLVVGSEPLRRKVVKQHIVRPGWNDYVHEVHMEAKDDFRRWVLAGKPRHGPVCEHKVRTNARFKYAVRFIKINETMRANSMAKKLQINNVYEFWKEVKVVNNSKMPLPSSIDGITEPENIAELWRRPYENIFNCVKSEVFNIGEIPHSDGVVIWPDEVSYAIEKLKINKACGQDKITAEHLKYSSQSISVLLALCFSGLMKHGILPGSMLSVLLIPVVQNKTSIDNYRPIALASILSKVIEGILMDRLADYVINRYGKLFAKLLERGVPSYIIRIL